MAKISFPPQTERWGNREWALTYAQIGWRVFPVHEPVALADGAGWMCSCARGADCDRPAKHPRTKTGLDEASNDRNQVERWWTQWPNASIGVATGRASGVSVVDADATNGKPGVVNLTQICAAQGGVPQTLTALTGGGGLHLYFIYTDRVATGSDVIGGKGSAIDVRNDGGYVIAPPSRHVLGVVYKWRAGNHGGEQLELPQWLADASRSGPADRGVGGAGGRRGRPRSQPGFRLERIESMLGVIDPDERDLWLNTGIILGRLYVGSGVENDAWSIYEAWASRSAKFDDDRAGNLTRMREAFHERSQAPPPRGGDALGVGTLIAAARAAGWTPFGDRSVVSWEPGNESVMCEELCAAIVGYERNSFFNVLGEIREVIKAVSPVVSELQHAAEHGLPPKETLLVRSATGPALLSVLSECAVLETVDRHGAPAARPIPDNIGQMILRGHSARFPVLSGVAEWPMVGADGSLIVKQHGYDAVQGLYFDIDAAVKIDEQFIAEAAWAWIRDEFFADFPFESEGDQANALAMLIAFLQRPLMKTCPAFAVTAPQPGTGKSTLVEIASMAIHGHDIMNCAFSDEPEELRKAIHGLLIGKTPAALFDNLRRGAAVDSDVIAKLLTSAVAADRTLGASDIRKEVNTLLVTFTGNNITFARDLTSRVLTIRLNAKASNPLGRKFKHRMVHKWALGERNRMLSALVALCRAGYALPEDDVGAGSRFADLDRLVARPVLAATGIDIREEFAKVPDQDTERDDELRGMLQAMLEWQNGRDPSVAKKTWRVGELVNAIEGQGLPESKIKVIRRAVGDERLWLSNPATAVGQVLKLMNGDHRFAPLMITSKFNASSKSNQWWVEGEGKTSTSGGF